MKPFVANPHRRLVFPSNSFSVPDFSSIDIVGDLAAVERRDPEVEAPTGSVTPGPAEHRPGSRCQPFWRCSRMKLAKPHLVALLTSAVVLSAAPAVATTNGIAGPRQQEPATPAAPRDPAAVEASLSLERPTRRSIQRGLRNEGVDPGPPDGLFGPRTRTAIRAWQRSRGALPTGYLNGAQADRLRAAGAAPPAAPAAARPPRRAPDRAAPALPAAAPPPRQAPDRAAPALPAAAARPSPPEADSGPPPDAGATEAVTPDSGYPAQQEGPDPLHPVPFLESTDLFWAPSYDSGLRYRIRTENRLEANIFPHFVIGFPSRCRGESSTWFRPCISATAGVRLRMGWDEPAPIRSPSFLPRANVQWLFYEEETTRGVTLQAGHHSNAQTGCLLAWSGHSGEESGGCADDAPGHEPGGSFVTAPDTTNGNFSLNYFRLIFDEARYGFLGIPAGRLSIGVEWNPRGWMHGPMRARYPSMRYLLALGLGLRDVGFCDRLELFVGGSRGSRLTGGGQATCIWSEERGIGMFVRPYFGADEYNSAFLGRSVGRLEVGFTINRIGTFGRYY